MTLHPIDWDFTALDTLTFALLGSQFGNGRKIERYIFSESPPWCVNDWDPFHSFCIQIKNPFMTLRQCKSIGSVEPTHFTL